MHEDNLSYAETFEDALQGLFTDEEGTAEIGPAEGPAATVGTQQLIQQAGNAFDRYLQLQAEKKFTEAAKELETLKNALDQLSASKE
jgi:uncharacterized membrane protein (UPF0182 family)